MRRIWVARPTPANHACNQILPVDWLAITQGGSTRTNYQLFPGDRVYVKADGSPGDFAPTNVPYKPPFFFPLSTKGVSPGDFVMVLGYPGLTFREIAGDLYISENTVKNHVRNILEKLHLHSRMEAVMYAVREKLLDIPGT